MRNLSLNERGSEPTYSSDPARADYACPAYREMAPRWVLVEDVRAGTLRFRAKSDEYLPKFEAEEPVDYASRVLMTFAEDSYASAIVDHTGLVFSEPLHPGPDVPPAILDLVEDIDGEGNHLDVFAASVLDSALHLGHSVILTDHPATDHIGTLKEKRAAQVRPYATLYTAADVLSWETEAVGGAVVLTRIMLREHVAESDGEFGSKSVERYREFRQVVNRDEKTQRARSLGAVTWRLFSQGAEGEPPVEYDSGTLTRIDHIPVRVVYGGEKLGYMHTRPTFFGLALKNVEEAQVQSDYAAVMHKCNVPTPVFIGRQRPPPGSKETIKMGQGIDIPTGGSAMMLEPAGTAIGATRTRMEDIRASMARHGATSGEAIKNLTATEASIQAKQRNAKLVRAARSLQDALEGMQADMAAFMGLKTGGSIQVNMEFSERTLDPQYLRVLLDAYTKDALPLEALMFALKNGKLPDDFSEEDAALRLISEHAATQDATALADNANQAATA